MTKSQYHKVKIKPFYKTVKKQFFTFFQGKSVLDLVSIDFDVDNISLFKKCDYTTVRIGYGKQMNLGYSIVRYSCLPVDTIICTDVFKYTEKYKEGLTNVVENLLKPGGLLLFSTSIAEEDIKKAIDIDSIFKDYLLSYDNDKDFLYFWGVKKPI